jgi:hypothetical protein
MFLYFSKISISAIGLAGLALFFSGGLRADDFADISIGDESVFVASKAGGLKHFVPDENVLRGLVDHSVAGVAADSDGYFYLQTDGIVQHSKINRLVEISGQFQRVESNGGRVLLQAVSGSWHEAFSDGSVIRKIEAPYALSWASAAGKEALVGISSETAEVVYGNPGAPLSDWKKLTVTHPKFSGVPLKVFLTENSLFILDTEQRLFVASVGEGGQLFDAQLVSNFLVDIAASQKMGVWGVDKHGNLFVWTGQGFEFRTATIAQEELVLNIDAEPQDQSLLASDQSFMALLLDDNTAEEENSDFPVALLKAPAKPKHTTSSPAKGQNHAVLPPARRLQSARFSRYVAQQFTSNPRLLIGSTLVIGSGMQCLSDSRLIGWLGECKSAATRWLITAQSTIANPEPKLPMLQNKQTGECLTFPAAGGGALTTAKCNIDDKNQQVKIFQHPTGIEIQNAAGNQVLTSSNLALSSGASTSSGKRSASTLGTNDPLANKLRRSGRNKIAESSKESKTKDDRVTREINIATWNGQGSSSDPDSNEPEKPASKKDLERIWQQVTVMRKTYPYIAMQECGNRNTLPGTTKSPIALYHHFDNVVIQNYTADASKNLRNVGDVYTYKVEEGYYITIFDWRLSRNGVCIVSPIPPDVVELVSDTNSKARINHPHKKGETPRPIVGPYPREGYLSSNDPAMPRASLLLRFNEPVFGAFYLASTHASSDSPSRNAKTRETAIHAASDGNITTVSLGDWNRDPINQDPSWRLSATGTLVVGREETHSQGNPTRFLDFASFLAPTPEKGKDPDQLVVRESRISATAGFSDHYGVGFTLVRDFTPADITRRQLLAFGQPDLVTVGKPNKAGATRIQIKSTNKCFGVTNGRADIATNRNCAADSPLDWWKIDKGAHTSIESYVKPGYFLCRTNDNKVVLQKGDDKAGCFWSARGIALGELTFCSSKTTPLFLTETTCNYADGGKPTLFVHPRKTTVGVNKPLNNNQRFNFLDIRSTSGD